MANEIDYLLTIVRRIRRYASFWEWPNKAVKELGVVKDLLTSMNQAGIIHYKNPRPVKDDWPDCTVEDEQGQLIAIEVTELVDEEAIQRSQRGQPVYGRWEDRDILNAVHNILLKKDQKSCHGSLYASVTLVIHTDESELNARRLFPLIRSGRFPHLSNIKEAYIICSYDPFTETYPYCEIPLDN
jgi:hypothetical protein